MRRESFNRPSRCTKSIFSLGTRPGYAGARGYLLKDSPPGEVLNAIRAAHKGESLIQPRVASRLLDRFSQLARAPDTGEVLSPRDVEVLQLMAKGTFNKEIATELLSAKAR